MGIPAVHLTDYVEDWLADCEYRQHSTATLATRRFLIEKFLWFVQERGYEVVGTSELRQFFLYLSNGHKESGGRWGNPQQNRAMRPVTVRTYHNHLRTFCRFLVKSDEIEVSPMDALSPPVSRTDQIQPFQPEHITKLLDAARKSRHPWRDRAILLVFLDTGIRCSELCGLKEKDLDIEARTLHVLGKGQKYRTVPFGVQTGRALARYLRRSRKTRQTDGILFQSDRKAGGAAAFTRNGMFQLVQRLGVEAGIQGVRCSPHTLRHTFAISFLRAGGNVFTLKNMLGHNSLNMTNRYVAVAQSDIEAQHRLYSPVDRMKKI